MHPRVLRQLGMKSTGQALPLAHENRLALHAHKDIYLPPGLRQSWRSDKNALHPDEAWIAIDIRLCHKGVELCAISVSLGGHIHEAKSRNRMIFRLTRDQNRTGTGPENRPSRLRKSHDWLDEFVPNKSL